MELSEILRSLQSGRISVARAERLLSLYSIEQIEDFAKIDIDRQKRRGIPEVIYAENKTIEELKKIAKKVLDKSDLVLLSRIREENYKEMLAFAKKSKWRTKTGRSTTSLLVRKKASRNSRGRVGIITAGTSDIGVAEEARLMCEAMGCKTYCVYDIGIAGLQRVFSSIKRLVTEDVDVMVVAAGMEGALASVVSSIVDVPVIGVPTSIGYGYGRKGVAALASMLQNCTLGMSVVNIDGGIGAGAVASIIARRANKRKKVL